MYSAFQVRHVARRVIFCSGLGQEAAVVQALQDILDHVRKLLELVAEELLRWLGGERKELVPTSVAIARLALRDLER